MVVVITPVRWGVKEWWRCMLKHPRALGGARVIGRRCKLTSVLFCSEQGIAKGREGFREGEEVQWRVWRWL